MRKSILKSPGKSLLFNLLIFLLPGILFSFGCSNTGQGKLTTLDLNEMLKKKDLIKNNDPASRKEFNILIHEADSFMTIRPVSVIHKKSIAPSGDKHDYLSLAPYFWPNPETPDSLPYIRKDGEVNPQNRNKNTDVYKAKLVFNATDILGQAYFYSENEKYADKAISFIQTWFTNSETRMNPNLNFGQGVPGKTDGRPYGIIEFAGIQKVINCIEILELSDKADNETLTKFNSWLKEYSLWLETSELGLLEKSRLNNHANWYDAQLSGILMHLGYEEKVRGIVENAKSNRIDQQIEPDGSQPLELERTKSFSYSSMNLRALTMLAYYGKKLNVDLWNYTSQDGRGIKKAYEFLIPFAIYDKPWEYQQIRSMEEARVVFAELLLFAGKNFGEPDYVAMAEGFLNKL